MRYYVQAVINSSPVIISFRDRDTASTFYWAFKEDSANGYWLDFLTEGRMLYVNSNTRFIDVADYPNNRSFRRALGLAPETAKPKRSVGKRAVRKKNRKTKGGL